MTSYLDIQPKRELHRQLKIQSCRKHHETDNIKLIKLLKFHLEFLWTYKYIVKYIKLFSQMWMASTEVCRKIRYILRNKGDRLHSIGLNNPLQNKLCRNISNANNKKDFALRDDIFPRFRICVPTLIFFQNLRELYGNCWFCNKSSSNIINWLSLPMSVGNTVIFPPPGLYYLPTQPQMAWKRREFYCTALGHVYIG